MSRFSFKLLRCVSVLRSHNIDTVLFYKPSKKAPGICSQHVSCSPAAWGYGDLFIIMSINFEVYQQTSREL